MRGHAMHHVGGGDRTVPFHAPYSPPKSKPTGLDWASLHTAPATTEQIADARPRCNHCRQPVDVVNVHTGMCDDCEHELDPHTATAAPTTQETAMTTRTVEIAGRPAAPYILELTELLIVTEGHPDPLVRATRKIVTQAAIALHQALTATTTSGTTRTATTTTPSSVPPSTSSAVPDTKPKRASSAAVLLMREHNLLAAEVRAWCHENGVTAPEKGSLPAAAVQAYVEAHPSAA